jgi:glycosyltransferase involved in cell wall biosynthesis
MPCSVSRDGTVFAHPVMGTFIESLANHFESVIYFSPQCDTMDLTSYPIPANGRIRFVSLGPGGYYWDHFHKMRRMCRIFEQTRDQWDILIIRTPTPRAYTVWKYAGKPERTVILLVGNFFSSSYATFLRPMGLLFFIRSMWFRQFLTRMCKISSHLITANSSSLVKYWINRTNAKVELIQTSSISDEDIISVSRTDLFRAPPYRLLFVGRVCFDKGIRELLAALRMLNTNNPNEYSLDVVGSLGDLGGISFQSLIEQHGVSKWVRYHGFVPFGERLFGFYRSADAYMLPSYHEGMPHTVWEAMSQGTPVVVSRIDGMRDFFSDRKDVLFVEPRNADSILESLMILEKDLGLCARLSANGIERARVVTREHQTMRLIELMTEKWFR